MKNEVAVKGVNYVEYESPYGLVQLDTNIVRKHFTKGNASITDSEIILFLEQCKRHKLDPFVTGEVFLIKYGNQNAQIVVGYHTYVRRAEESPNFIGKEEGIVVLRGNDIIKKEGTCLYPQERLLGGWCRVSYLNNGHPASAYKEVDLKEYNKENSMWKSMPATMITKVARSQALKEAFPTQMNGLYIPEEIAPKEAREGDFEPVVVGEVKLGEIQSPIISTEDRKKLFAKVKDKLGSESGTEWLKEQVKALGLDSTTKLTEDNLKAIYESLNKENEPIEADVIELDDTVQCVLDVVEEEARKDK